MCSQFENDKRLMEYMIKTRYEVKNLTKDLRKTEEYLLAVLEWRKKETRQLEEGLLNITEKS
jgi:DNA-directed RNA polymerase subunit F